ncbi:hypothetical protein [Ketobacter sp.]|uniref:hypothetical protein n=1 Tax=Ketobacter sp. TaxID=2083498 RepID=UPI0025C1ADDA|nr:hypothetical protein [Ketobacter sp.]
MKIPVNRSASIATVLLSSLVTSCVTAESIVVNQPKTNPSVKPIKEASTDEYMPFFVAFKKDGTPVIYSRDGVALENRPLKFPLTTSKVYNVKTYTFGAVEGSCDVFWMYGSAGGITGFTPEVCKYFVNTPK